MFSLINLGMHTDLYVHIQRVTFEDSYMLRLLNKLATLNVL